MSPPLQTEGDEPDALTPPAEKIAGDRVRLCAFGQNGAGVDSGLRPLTGHDIVVQWDADDDDHDHYAKAALMVATALSVRATTHGQRDVASFAKIDRAMERVRKAVEGFDEINVPANTAKPSADRIFERATGSCRSRPPRSRTSAPNSGS